MICPDITETVDWALKRNYLPSYHGAVINRGCFIPIAEVSSFIISLLESLTVLYFVVIEDSQVKTWRSVA